MWKELNIIYSLGMTVLAVFAFGVGRGWPVQMEVLVFLVINVSVGPPTKEDLNVMWHLGMEVLTIFVTYAGIGLKSESFLNVSELLSHLVLFSATRETCVCHLNLIQTIKQWNMGMDYGKTM